MMTALVASLSTAALLAGVLLVVLSTRVSSRRTKRSRSAVPEARRKVLLLIGVGFVVGILVAMFTGLVVAVLVTPVAFVGVPYLLGGGNGKYRIQRLEALESWTRTLTGLSVTGATIEQALSASYATAPKEIKTELQHFLQRLDAGWSTSRRFLHSQMSSMTLPLTSSLRCLPCRRLCAGRGLPMRSRILLGLWLRKPRHDALSRPIERNHVRRLGGSPSSLHPASCALHSLDISLHMQKLLLGKPSLLSSLPASSYCFFG